MAIRITCPDCGHTGDAPDESRGLRVRCPHCQADFVADPPPAGPRAVARRRPDPVVRYAEPGDDRPRRRRRREFDHGFRCPYCGTGRNPAVVTRIAPGGWVTFGLILGLSVVLTALGAVCILFCFAILLAPLCVLGLLIKDEVRVCAECGVKLG